ncbi:MAG: DUF3073 domain-containing protein [Catenulisporales bacterium]|jgi:hypothetical protein|nr:DUF3073 domain-containing protein [Catenulisporales bacterium]
MGRGRAKAKQTRVARDLKYRGVDTDLTQLQRELQRDGVHTSNGHSATAPSPDDEAAEEDDLYAKYADYVGDDDDIDSEDDGGSHRSHHRRS